MKLKRVGISIFLALVCVFLCGVVFAAKSSEFAAKANGVGIKKATLETAVNNFIENQKAFGMQIKEEDKAKVKDGILQELVTAELLYQESQKAKLGDLSKEIDAQLENIKKGFNSGDDFAKILKERNITEKDLKDDIRRGVYITTFLDKNVYQDISIKEEDKKKEFENNKDKLDVPETARVTHILIKVSKDASDADKQKAKEKIEDLRKKALAGEDFEKLAKENSEDNSAARGGDIGYFARGETVKPFEDAAFSLEKGAISDIIETQFGYHVLKVLDKQPARKLTYEEVEKDIDRFLVNKARREKLEKFVAELKKKAKIEILKD